MTVSLNSCVVAIGCPFLRFLVCVKEDESHWLETMKEVCKVDGDDNSVGPIKSAALVAVGRR